MADLVKVTIDGKEIEVEPGTFIIEAARKLGIEIPSLCYDPRLKSVGSCRMCLVEVEKMPRMVASCSMPVMPGMVIHTNNEKVIKARKGVLEFILINHPLDCPTCDKGGECLLQNQVVKYGSDTSRYTEDKIRKIDNPNQKFDDVRLGPEIWMNKNRCIMCFKCVRINRELAGGTDLGIFYRGAFARVDIPSELKYTNEFSGNTVECCPVGALTADSFRYKIRSWLLDKTKSVAWLCPDGSNMFIEHNQGKIYRHTSRQNDNVEVGFLCDKDRFGFDITSHPDRLRLPMADDKGPMAKISYEEAVAIAIHQLTDIKSEEAALLMDTTLTNEEAFCASEFYQYALPSSSIAISSEFDIANEIPATDLGLSIEMKNLEQADMILIAGCDLASEHPIVSLRIKKLITKGMPVYFINNRDMSLGRFDVYNIRASYGKEYEIIDKIIALKSGSDSAGLFDNMKNQLIGDFGRCKNIHILTGADMLANPNRNKYLSSLRKLSESLKAKLSILTAETNYLGVKLCGQQNSTLDGIIRKIEDGKIKTLFIAGGNPVNVYPNRKRITEAFKKLNYLIYWGAFSNDTAKLAGLIIPAALPTENAGSYINIERRLQFMKKPYALPKGMTTLIRLINDMKIDMSGKPCYSAAEAFSKMAEAIPEFKNLKYEYSEGHLFASTDNNKLINNDSQIDIAPPDEFPYTLTFSRSVYYGASGITSKSQTLEKLTPPQTLIMNPDDAQKEGLESGSTVKLETNSANGKFPLSVSGDINAGELVLFGYSEKNPPNEFMTGFNTPVYAKVSKA
ncbi:MAG: NADH-quinone oxidoreductase subunit NuoG [candidate division Zixibacteria bacterium]|nr:NADH-quinone oxidoreductase subunit NuoG [candidate division Zixibacteria bacterium]